jgi:hypothetical protein
MLSGATLTETRILQLKKLRAAWERLSGPTLQLGFKQCGAAFRLAGWALAQEQDVIACLKSMGMTDREIAREDPVSLSSGIEAYWLKMVSWEVVPYLPLGF